MASGFNSTGRLPVGQVPSMTQIFDKTRFIYYPAPAKKGGGGGEAPASDRLIVDLTIHDEHADFGSGSPQVKELWIKNRKLAPQALKALPARSFEVDFNLNPKVAAPKLSISTRPGSAMASTHGRPDSRVSFAPDLTTTSLSVSSLPLARSASLSSTSLPLSSMRPHSARVRLDPQLAVTHRRSPRRHVVSSSSAPAPASSHHNHHRTKDVDAEIDNADAGFAQPLFGSTAPQLLSRADRLVVTSHAQSTRRRFNETHGEHIAQVRAERAPRGGLSPTQATLAAAAAFGAPDAHRHASPPAHHSSPLHGAAAPSVRRRPMSATPSLTTSPLVCLGTSAASASSKPASARLSARPSTAASATAAPIPTAFTTTAAAIGRGASVALDTLGASSTSSYRHPALPHDYVAPPPPLPSLKTASSVAQRPASAHGSPLRASHNRLMPYQNANVHATLRSSGTAAAASDC